jgi:hypothetical protein
MVEMTPIDFKKFCEDHGVRMSGRMAYYIHSGQSHFGINRAIILSQTTDVPLVAWIKPDQVYNKYLAHLFEGQKASNGS